MQNSDESENTRKSKVLWGLMKKHIVHTSYIVFNYILHLETLFIEPKPSTWQ